MAIATTTLAAVDATQEDEKLVSVLEQYDEYLIDQQHAIELLKQGFLKLTMAKLNLPAHALGELSYKDGFEAALCVSVESDGALSVVKGGDRVRDANSTPESPVEPRNAVVKRRTQASDNMKEKTSTASPVVSGGNQEDAAIMWFSSLPPSHLRMAQKNFRSALHALLASAASARKIQSGVNELTSTAIKS